MRNEELKPSKKFLENNIGFGLYMGELNSNNMLVHVPENCIYSNHVTLFSEEAEGVVCGTGGFSPPEEEGDPWKGFIVTRGGVKYTGEVVHVGGLSPEEFLRDSRTSKVSALKRSLHNLSDRVFGKIS